MFATRTSRRRATIHTKSINGSERTIFVSNVLSCGGCNAGGCTHVEKRCAIQQIRTQNVQLDSHCAMTLTGQALQRPAEIDGSFFVRHVPDVFVADVGKNPANYDMK